MKYLYILLSFSFPSCADVESAPDFYGIYCLEYFNKDIYLVSRDTLYIYSNGTYEHVLSSAKNRKRIKVNSGSWKLEEGHLLLNEYVYLEADDDFFPFTIDFRAKRNIRGGIKYLKQRTNILEGIKYNKQTIIR